MSAYAKLKAENAELRAKLQQANDRANQAYVQLWRLRNNVEDIIATLADPEGDR